MSYSPVDSNGRVITHLGSVRSQLTGQASIMDLNDRPRFEKFSAEIIDSLKPVGALEIQLAQTIAHDYWRLNRAHVIEEGIFAIWHPEPTGDIGDHTMEYDIARAQTCNFVREQSTFKFLSLYEGRIQRMLTRNKAELKQLQAERRKLAENGFVFSNQPPAPEQHTAVATGSGFSEPPAAEVQPPAPSTSKPNGFVFSNETTEPGADFTTLVWQSPTHVQDCLQKPLSSLGL